MPLKVLGYAAGIGLTCVLALSACSRAQPTSVAQTTPIETEEAARAATPTGELASITPTLAPTVTPTDMPETQAAPTQAPTVDAYPAPEQPEDAYPGPDSVPTAAPTSMDSGAYPAPGADTPVSPPTPSPRATQEQTPTRTTVARPTATFTPAPPRPTIDIQLRATDPETVKLASGKIQFVEFFAFWCGICRAMAPIVHELEAEYGDRMNFIYLDIDDPATKEFREEFNNRHQPQFFLLDEQGKILKQWTDYVEEQELRENFEAVLQ